MDEQKARKMVKEAEEVRTCLVQAKYYYGGRLVNVIGYTDIKRLTSKRTIKLLNNFYDAIEESLRLTRVELWVAGIRKDIIMRYKGKIIHLTY